MKLLQAIFSGVCMMLSANAFQEASGWRAIVPLHSTRADVERALGSSDDQCKCIYKTEHEVVHVDYAAAPCKGTLPGWNVPADTVLSFTITSKAEQRFSALSIDESKYVKTRDDVLTTYYTNKDEGIKYAVTATGMVESISYIPATKDNSLRCSGFPSYGGSVARHRPFDYYSNLAFNDEKARLDTFAAWLRQYPELIGYVVVYGGRRARAGEARARAERAKKYIVNKRAIEAARIIVIDGGQREDLEVELYALPSRTSAPL